MHNLKKVTSFFLRHNPLSRFIPDKLYLRWLYNLQIGNGDFSNPKTFNGKIQHLKMQDRNPMHTTMVDKYAVKQYVADIVGNEHIIPAIGVWDHFDDIDFDALPEQFVLKTTHGGGGMDVIVVKDKTKLNRKEARTRLESSLKRSIWQIYREWPYKNVPRRIIAEPYMEDENGELRDYKFFCMDGEPRFLFLATGRLSSGETTFDFLDLNYNRLPVRNGHPNMEGIPKPPINFNKMIELARRLSQGEKFVRVDLYNIRGKIYFGEYTFFHNSGLVPLDPPEWDYRFGEYINI